MTLDQFVYVGEMNGQKMAVNLTKGVFRFTTGVLEKNAYIISTPNAAIGIRGTVLDIGVQSAQSKVTLVEGQALVCPRRPGVTFAQQIRNCTRAAGGPAGPHCECVDLHNAGQTALVKRSGGTNEASLTSTPSQFCLELRRRRFALFGRHLRVRHDSRRRGRLPSRRPVRTMSATPARRAHWLLASTSAAAFVCWSEVALAACETPPAGGVLAEGQTCEVSGAFTTTADDAIAGHATGVGALISGPGGEGAVTFTFSTTGDTANGLQADAGGNINLTPTVAAPGTVETSGEGSFGLFATGSGEGEEGLVSHINAFNLNVSTTGPNAFGAEATNGAFISLTGGSVTTSGFISEGLAVLGAGSTIQASGVAVTTHGDSNESASEFATGVFAFTGGSMTFSGGSITTTGISADAVAVLGSGASIALNGGTAILTTGNGSVGLVISGSGALLTATGVSVTTHGDVDPSTGNLAFGAYNGVAESPTGGMLKLTDTTIVTTGVDAEGVNTNSGGTTTINGGSVTTSGNGAIGLFAHGAGSTITASGVAVTTSGGFSTATSTFANGIVAVTGGGITFSGGSITSNASEGGDAAVAIGNGASLILNGGSTIFATADGTDGLDVIGTGASLTANGIAVTTHGNVGSTFGFNSIGAFNGGECSCVGTVTGGGLMSLTDTTILTTGNLAQGVLTQDGGQTTISGGSVTTSGIGSQALFVTGAGSSITATGVALATSGNFDTSTNSSSNGLDAVNGAKAVFSGGSISTAGNAAYAVVADGKGSINLSGTTISTTGNGSGGLAINGSGSEIDAAGVTITTTGGMDPVTGQHSYGIYNGPFGEFASGGVAKITDLTISTQGAAMFGVLTGLGGSTTITGGSYSTSGSIADVIVGQGAGSSVSVSGATITSTGLGSPGATLVGAGSSMSLSNDKITTSGQPFAAGRDAVGVFNGTSANGGFVGGGALTITDSTITTSGVRAAGVVTANGGQTNVTGGSVSTAGQDAHALFVTGLGSQANLGGAGTFATTGAGAIGFYAALGGAISTTGSTMTTIATSGGVSPATSLGAYGINADGAGSLIKLGSATVTTSGAGATGLFASDRASSGAAGTITASGTLNVQTKNASAAAVALQGNGATITATGGGTIAAAGTAIAFHGRDRPDRNV